MAEATFLRESDVFREIVPTAGWSSGEVIQLADGRAAYVTSQTALVDDQVGGLKVDGVVKLAKTASVVCLKGGPAYWDRSAGTCTPLRAEAGGDFFCGSFADDATSSATTCEVNLNVAPSYTIDVMRDQTTTAVVANGTVTLMPGYIKLLFTTATEAQKADVLSDSSWTVATPFVVEGRFTIIDNGDNAAYDFNVGVANETHASDCDTIGESAFIHIDGNALDIYTESDNGVATEVGADDTGVNFAEGTPVDFAIDGRDNTDIVFYINGVAVNTDATFVLNGATGPLMLLAHLEKSSDDSPGQVNIEKLAVRLMDIAD